MGAWGASRPKCGDAVVSLTSSLTKQARSSREAYEATTTAMDAAHRLRPRPFEVGIDALRGSKDVTSPAAIRDAIASTNLNTVVGPIAWGKGPVKNVCKTPLVGGQWVKGKKYKYELVIVNNQTAPNIPTGGTLKPMP